MVDIQILKSMSNEDLINEILDNEELINAQNSKILKMRAEASLTESYASGNATALATEQAAHALTQSYASGNATALATEQAAHALTQSYASGNATALATEQAAHALTQSYASGNATALAKLKNSTVQLNWCDKVFETCKEEYFKQDKVGDFCAKYAYCFGNEG